MTSAQTQLTEAVNFHVKTVEGTPYWLFDLLEQDKIVVIDFFTTSCGPCQEYAPDFQQAYEEFGENQSNVFFIGINYGEDNASIREFDSLFSLSYPSVSGIQGGGDYVYADYQIEAYPTVIVITPDQQIVEQFLWPPSFDNIVDAVLEAGGLYVGTREKQKFSTRAKIYPNPASTESVLELSLDHPANLQYQIIDLMGAVVYQSEKTSENKTTELFNIPVGKLQNGLYFVRILANEKAIYTKQFVVAR